MRTPNQHALFSLSLSALLLLPAVPALAQDDPKDGGRIELRLQEALEFQGALRLGSLAEARKPAGYAGDYAPRQTRLGQTDLATVQQDSQRLEEIGAQTTLANRAKPKEGKFGRWIKKHWYVPVIAAAAIGVALSDDGSDGPGDEED